MRKTVSRNNGRIGKILVRATEPAEAAVNLTLWHIAGCVSSAALNGDGVVDLADLSILLANYNHNFGSSPAGAAGKPAAAKPSSATGAAGGQNAGPSCTVAPPIMTITRPLAIPHVNAVASDKLLQSAAWEPPLDDLGWLAVLGSGDRHRKSGKDLFARGVDLALADFFWVSDPCTT
jgi:hypothetical protein